MVYLTFVQYTVLIGVQRRVQLRVVSFQARWLELVAGMVLIWLVA